MAFDFDKVIERRGGDSYKWNQPMEADFLPMPVADMDFPASPAILEALHRRTDHGIFGYAQAPSSTIEAIGEKLLKDYGWEIDPVWLVWLPGVVVSLNVVCRMLEQPGDAVVTTTPIYPPFLSAPEHAQRPRRDVPLDVENGRYTFPMDRLAAALDGDARLFMHCNPHNPSGRCLTRTELEQIAEICLSRDVVICSDEIHCGLILEEGARHIPMATLSPEVAARTITLMSPSKTYNLAGLMWAFAIIPDPSLRRRFLHTARGIVTEVSPYGYAACEAAYRRSDDWHAELIRVLRRNRDLVAAAVREVPGLWSPTVEATYLAWIDCRALPIAGNPALHFEKAGLGLGDGSKFGAPGFVRMNFSCPLPTLEEGLRRFKAAACAGK